MKRLLKALRSFYCAGRGIAFCMRHERHFRIHLAATAYVMYFASFYDFTGTDYAVLAVTCASVISMEIINTSVEVVIDKVSPKYNIFAMIGKDLASGAVLFSALGAVAIGFFMFWDTAVFVKIFDYFSSSFLRCALLLLSVTASAVFVVSARPRRAGKRLPENGEREERKSQT